MGKFFELISLRVVDEKWLGEQPPKSEARIMLKVGDVREHTAAQGNGPVDALYNVLRKALASFYPELEAVELHDYKVLVLKDGTNAVSVQVLVEFSSSNDQWKGFGDSPNVIDAIWQALVDGIEYKLKKDEEQQQLAEALLASG